MLEFTNSSLQKIIIHGIGKKTENEGVTLSKSPAVLDEEINDLLMKYFLSPFKSEETFSFYHEDSLEQNTLYNLAKEIFENPDENFIEKSEKIAWHLYSVSSHPKINSGEMYVVYFDNVIIDEIETDAIGIFKSENKDTFLKVFEKNSNLELAADTGINIKKLEKGCLIFNDEDDDGYKISIVDKLSQGGEAAYWRDDFIKAKVRKDNYTDTKYFLDIVKGFSEHILNEDNNVETPDRIAFLKRTQDYFKKNEHFNENEFEEEVVGAPEVIDAFKDYKDDFIKSYDLPEIDENFDISRTAFKAQNKYFKSVIKLDKNFHIYVHSKPEYIEKGFDEDRKMKYYKLYYNNEE